MITYHNYTDQELIEKIKQGHDTAFNEIHRRYFKTLFISACNVLNDNEACLDIIQDVFIWFWEHRDQHNIVNIRGYLLMAVKYQVSNYIRKGKVRENYRLNQIEEFTINEESLELRELQNIIENFTKNLPERSRLIFQMSREQNLSNKEIALQLGITEKTVSGLLSRALKKLKGDLGKMNFWIHFFI